ncbi:MAG: hypothetical protein C4582_11835 [Desulfobacteraceae bacterium]|nr:MAG: hypothetical protein C4582_11835 [Desulfobacteraceae bacterium]
MSVVISRAFTCSLFLLAFFFSLQSCAPLIPDTSKKRLTSAERDQAMSLLAKEDLKASTFFGTGHLTVEGPDSYSKAPILLVGRRQPLALRLEITHPWGKPLAHMVVKKQGFMLLVFQEAKCYEGDASAMAGQGALPISLSPHELWGIARGFPMLEGFRPVESTGISEIRLLEAHENSEKILKLDGNTPRSIVFPGRGIEINYDGFTRGGGISFAPIVRVSSEAGKHTVTIKHDQMEFNTPISEALFQLDVPQEFEKVRVTGFKNTPMAPAKDDSDRL